VTTAVIIVSYGRPQDVRQCLRALAEADRDAPFDIFLVENAGRDAFIALVALLVAEGLALQPQSGAAAPFRRLARMSGGPRDATVCCGLAAENLGFAGGVNLWLRRLEREARYDGFWILNPDTQPQSGALAALVDHAARHGLGMVGSQLAAMARPDEIATRGQHWRPLVCRPRALDRARPARSPPGRDLALRLDAPSGASFYVTRIGLQQIGPMEESYFLYYEDLEWGLRAKAACGLGLAEDSIVLHVGGATIGSAASRRARSALSVYLDHRNRLIFVRRMYPRHRGWTALVVLARTLEFLFVGAFDNFLAALAGWAAGLRGETGRPDRFFSTGAAQR
jgi:GT2 family glycosyltransferase